MIKKICLILTFLAVATGIDAQPASSPINLPLIADSAAAYRKSIETRPAEPAAKVIRDIKLAESAGNRTGVIDSYERLAALNAKAFRAWLQLGFAWRELDKTAEKGLAASFNAFDVAPSAPEKLEALLLLSSFLRARLEGVRRDYENARKDVQSAELILQNLKEAAEKNDTVSLDRDDRLGNFNLVTEAREQASQRVEHGLQQFALLISELDEVYRLMSAAVPGVPGLQAGALKAADTRSEVFAAVVAPNADGPEVKFQIEGEDIRACIDFTQELRTNDQVYRNLVTVTYPIPDKTTEYIAATGYGVQAKDRSLCITGLKAEIRYRIEIAAGLPSRQDAKLPEPGLKFESVTLPDLPERIAFSGRQFILPTSGAGEVPLQATNIARDVDLQIVRVTDRALYRHIALKHIGGDLSDDEFTELRDTFGERIWSGSADFFNSGGKKNEAVKTLLPVRAILDERRALISREISNNPKSQGPLKFPMLRRSYPVADRRSPDQQVSLYGEFFAGSMQFEAAASDRPSPGVYALVAAELNTPAAKRERAGCREQCPERAAQWFLETDIGLTFYEGSEEFTVVARSLSSGQAKVHAKIELISIGNRLLDTQETNEHGVATFKRSLTRGTQSNKLVAILAYYEKDFGFLPVNAERLDLSRLNVGGRPVAYGFNAFLTTDRGIYQPGEDIHLLALIRDQNGLAPEPGPKATVRLETRDRAPVQPRIEPTDWNLGGAELTLKVPNSIRPGTARIVLALGDGEDAPVIGETTVQLGAVKPDRARLEFEKNSEVRKTTDSKIGLTGDVKAQYMFAEPGTRQGAARGLKAEVLVKIAASQSPAPGCFKGFDFGKFDDKPLTVAKREFVEYTDSAGSVKLANLAPIGLPVSDKPLAATVEVTIFDEAGPLASRTKTFPIANNRGWLGLSKIPRLRPGSAGAFNLDVDLVSIAQDNKLDENGAFEFSLERERDRYAWERNRDSWQHVKYPSRTVVAAGPIQRLTRVPSGSPPEEGANCPDALHIADLARDLDVGRYVLTIKDTRGPRQASVRFHVGSAVVDADQIEPNMFTLSTDKRSYRPGEQMVVTAAVPFDGEVLVAFAEGDIMRWEKGTAKRGEAKIPFTIPSEWKGKGIYVLATVFRSGATETTRAGPNRAIGITYFDVKGEHSGYAAAIEVLGNARQGHITPDEDLSFKVCVADSTGKCSASPPKDAYAVAFVVDEGLLSLTGRDEAVVDPERYFYGRKAFALQIMDNYDRLLLRDGGDRPTRLALSNFRSTRIVSVSRGPTKLENGSATFTIPKIALAEGAVSIFSVVWSRDYAAAATEKVPVRGFVVADLHSPTFLLAGDRAVLPLRLDNIQYPHRGEFAVRVTSSGPIAGLAMFEKGKRPPPVAAQAELRTVLNQNEPGQTVYVALDTSPDGQGEAKLQVSIDPIGASEPLRGNKREWTFDVRPALLASVDTISFPLERGAVNLRTLIENEIKANYDPKSVMITARFSDSTKALLTASVGSTDPKTSSVLDRLVWQGLFLLHSGDPSRGPAQSAGITRILGEIQSLQAADGSFVPYRTPGDTVGISPDAIMQNAMALDFLWLAGNAGYSVPEKSVRAARQSLVAQLRLAFGPGTFEPNCTLAHLYSVLVLLNAGHTEHERINSFKKCKFENDDVARAAAAAVMAKYGFSNEATLILANFQDGKDPKRFGELNDFRAAMMLTFLVEAGAPSPLLEAVAEILLKPTAAQIKGSSAFAGNGSSLSGATAAWLTRAAKTSPDSTAKLALSDFMIDGGVSSPASLLQRGRTGAFEMSPVRFSELSPTLSIGTKPEIRGVRGSVTIEGVRTKPHEAERVPTGAIKRRFFNPVTGAEINPAAERFGFGDRVIVVVEGDRRVLRTTPKPAPRNQRPAGAAPSEPESDSDVNEPVLLVDLLPSAFQVLSNTTLGRPDLPGMLGKLPRRGNLQSVETSPDRWVALIVPESRKPPPNAGAVPPQQPPPSAAAPAAEPSADDKVEFRQAYSVRVNMAGRFILPPLSIEETKPPVRTMWTEPTRIEIRLPEASSQ